MSLKNGKWVDQKEKIILQFQVVLILRPVLGTEEAFSGGNRALIHLGSRGSHAFGIELNFDDKAIEMKEFLFHKIQSTVIVCRQLPGMVLFNQKISETIGFLFYRHI